MWSTSPRRWTLQRHRQGFATAYYHCSSSSTESLARDADRRPRARLPAWRNSAVGAQHLGHIEPEALIEYERFFSTPEAIHATCEDYRASAGIDLQHDRDSRERGDKVRCDIHVLWGQRGVVNKFFTPIELWQAQCAGTVTGEAMPSGHFIPEELPLETTNALVQFFGLAVAGA